MDFLLFRLYGPMASWGTIAVGQERPSDTYPSKSALLGLLAAAMGVRRDQHNLHQQMAEACGVAIRVDTPGEFLQDYHTIQVPPTRRNVVHYTRRDELNAETLNTILSSREYRCDALYTVALWLRDRQPAPYTLEALATGLNRPRFSLYLGRKSCPLALPVQATLVTTDHLEAAFTETHFKDEFDFPHDLLKRSREVLVYWEADDASVNAGGWQPLQTMTRRDQPLSRMRWQFGLRREHQTHVARHQEE